MTCQRVGRAIVCGRGPRQRGPVSQHDQQEIDLFRDDIRSRSERIGDKVAHVQRAGQTRNHTCHWPGCDRQVPPAMWGCKQHWFALPEDLRSRIWATYKIGQEQTGRPSAEYLDVAREVQDWIQRKVAPAAPAPLADAALPDCPGPEWHRNRGHRPDGELKRIRVVLRHGREPEYADALNPMAPPGWAADTTRWSLTGSPFDVAWYRPL